jgi:hypothetical protein
MAEGVNVKIQSQKIKSSVFIGLALLMVISMGAGCASTRKTTTTETTVQYANKENPLVEEKSTSTGVSSDQAGQTTVEKSTTTTTTAETKPEQTGLIGGVFHVIGSVIALPFILIGGLLRMIF